MRHKNASEKWAYYGSWLGVILFAGIWLVILYIYCKQEGILP